MRVTTAVVGVVIPAGQGNLAPLPALVQAALSSGLELSSQGGSVAPPQPPCSTTLRGFPKPMPLGLHNPQLHVLLVPACAEKTRWATSLPSLRDLTPTLARSSLAPTVMPSRRQVRGSHAGWDSGVVSLSMPRSCTGHTWLVPFGKHGVHLKR